MSVIAMRTVSIRPASTSALKVSRSRRPFGFVSMGSFLASGQFGFGLLDGSELLLRGLGDQVVAAVEKEVNDKERVDAERDERRRRVHYKGRYDGEHRQHERHAGGRDAARCAVGAVEIRLGAAQDYVREHHQNVTYRGAEDGDVYKDRAVARKRHQEADDARNDERHSRRPAAAW